MEAGTDADYDWGKNDVEGTTGKRLGRNP
ncbi:hypothetical protein BSG1_02950 [Bacillus sp. SG-1]|nr:hypothetical protein BSG1_02950 [Bacillus sp. SG-1]